MVATRCFAAHEVQEAKRQAQEEAKNFRSQTVHNEQRLQNVEMQRENEKAIFAQETLCRRTQK